MPSTTRVSSSRNERNNGRLRVKDTLTILILLTICLWLLYQSKHLHFKNIIVVEMSLMSSSRADERSSELLKLGRKDLQHGEGGDGIQDEMHIREAGDAADEGDDENEEEFKQMMEDLQGAEDEGGSEQQQERDDGQEEHDKTAEDGGGGEQEQDRDDEQEHSDKAPEDGDVEVKDGDSEAETEYNDLEESGEEVESSEENNIERDDRSNDRENILKKFSKIGHANVRWLNRNIPAAAVLVNGTGLSKHETSIKIDKEEGAGGDRHAVSIMLITAASSGNETVYSTITDSTANSLHPPNQSFIMELSKGENTTIKLENAGKNDSTVEHVWKEPAENSSMVTGQEDPKEQ